MQGYGAKAHETLTHI